MPLRSYRRAPTYLLNIVTDRLAHRCARRAPTPPDRTVRRLHGLGVTLRIADRRTRHAAAQARPQARERREIAGLGDRQRHIGFAVRRDEILEPKRRQAGGGEP